MGIAAGEPLVATLKGVRWSRPRSGRARAWRARAHRACRSATAPAWRSPRNSVGVPAVTADRAWAGLDVGLEVVVVR